MNSSRPSPIAGRGANAYARVGVESGVMSADPLHLIVMLFDGAEASIRNAQKCMESGQIAAKGKAISRAIDIVNQGLLAALDMQKGGDVAGNLGRIYEYITSLLLRANLHNDMAALQQAERLLTDISSAWRQLETMSKAS